MVSKGRREACRSTEQTQVQFSIITQLLCSVDSTETLEETGQAVQRAAAKTQSHTKPRRHSKYLSPYTYPTVAHLYNETQVSSKKKERKLMTINR